MIRHLLLHQTDHLRELQEGDFVAGFRAYVGDNLKDPLTASPYFGNTIGWLATPSNAAEILRLMAAHLRPRLPGVRVDIDPELFCGALEIPESEKGPACVLLFQAEYLSAEDCRNLRAMSADIDKTEGEYQRRGLPASDPLQGMERLPIWSLAAP